MHTYVDSYWMKFKEVMDQLLQFEKTYSLDQIEIGGLLIWDYLRFQVYMQLPILLGIYENDAHIISNVRWKKIKLLIKSIFNFRRNPYLSSQKDIMIIGSARRKLIDGKWMDIICDPLLNDLDYSYIYIENHFQYGHVSPTYTCKAYYLDIITFLALLQQKIKRRNFNIKKTDQEKIIWLGQILQEEFNVKIDFLPLVQNILLQSAVLHKKYAKLLKKIQPKALIIVCSYGYELLIKEAKKQNIPVIELQHGVINYYHFGYSYPFIKKTQFPDYLFLFGDYWKRTIPYPLRKDSIYPIGYKFFDIRKKAVSTKSKKNNVLVISGPYIGDSIVDKTVEIAKQNKEIEFVFKLHPNEKLPWKKYYSSLDLPNISVIDTQEIDLYELLRDANCLIGVNSTVLYEGLAFGIPVFILEVEGYEYMQDLIEDDIVVFLDETSKFGDLYSSIINNQTQKKIGNDIIKSYDQKFLNNSLRHIIRSFE